MENTTYEQALTELQQIVEALENGNINIDELAAQTERAAELIRFCQEKLRQTEERIQRLFD
ncbi:MAG TPA: exodeoxyribonuclease VII small subunit [Saprospiraceae bacterium]|nr:exodeoxyribonuclease VII small subunit [Saprospiraceae bacterium]